MLMLTEKAVAAVMGACNGEELGLRVSVEKGCSSLTYNLGLEPEAEQGDEILSFGPLKVFVDPASAMYLTGVTMDYVEGASGSGFVFDNPNAPAPPKGCSCSSGRCG